MTFVRMPRAFVSPTTGLPVRGYIEKIDEPEHAESPDPPNETPGEVFALKDTPSGGHRERYAAFVTSGPTNRLRLDVALDGGATVDLLEDGPLAVGGTPGIARDLTVQAVALEHGEAESGKVVIALVREYSGAADWLS